MVTIRKTITDKAGRTLEMRATPDRPFEPAFDSNVILHENGSDNHTLTLVLKLNLNQIVPTTLDLGRFGTFQLPFADADKKLFRIKPWTATAFSTFSKEFLRQCAYWNNKFWLIPPPVSPRSTTSSPAAPSIRTGTATCTSIWSAPPAAPIARSTSSTSTGR